MTESGAEPSAPPALPEPVLSHRVCPSCGTYKDRQVVEGG